MQECVGTQTKQNWDQAYFVLKLMTELVQIEPRAFTFITILLKHVPVWAYYGYCAHTMSQVLRFPLLYFFFPFGYKFWLKLDMGLDGCLYTYAWINKSFL